MNLKVLNKFFETHCMHYKPLNKSQLVINLVEEMQHTERIKSEIFLNNFGYEKRSILLSPYDLLILFTLSQILCLFAWKILIKAKKKSAVPQIKFCPY